MFCALQNTLKYLEDFQDEGWLLNFCPFSILKNNLRLLFSKKTEKRKKETNQPVTHWLPFLYISSQKYSCNVTSFLLAGVCGGDGLFSFSKQRSCSYLQITQKNVVIYLRTVFVLLCPRAEVVAFSWAKKRKLRSSETVSCCWEIQTCDPKKSQVKTYIISTRDEFPKNTLLYAHNSLWNNRLQHPCNLLIKR